MSRKCCALTSRRRLRVFVLLAAGFLDGPDSGLRAQDGPASSEGSGSISGKLVDSAGPPVSGARLSLYRLDEKRHWTPTGATVASDNEGAYRFGGLGKESFRIVVQKDGLARTIIQASLYEERQHRKDLVLRPAVASAVMVRDEAGTPIVGARLRAFQQRGVNGQLFLTNVWMKELGVESSPSDEMGRLLLPPIQTDEIVHLWIEHADFAPTELRDVAVRDKATANATLRHGVRVKMHFVPTAADDHIAKIRVNLRHDPYENPSTITDYEAPVKKDGTASLTIEPGDYSIIQLQHDDYFITPTIGAIGAFRIEAARNDELWFQLRRKVQARGRLIDAETGEPLAAESVLGETLNSAPREMPGAPREMWAFTAWGITDQEGKYKIEFPEGAARVSFDAQGFISETDHTEFSVNKDSANIIPDIKTRRLPKITGLVQNPDGKPASMAVVRFRGNPLRHMQPVITDEAGRFEIDRAWVPLDDKTEKRLVMQPLVAFDPRRPLSVRAEVRVDSPDAGVLKLEPHEPDWVLSEFTDELTEWERGKLTPERAQAIAGISLQNQPAPELDGVLWLNSTKPSMQIADFRGKFVLLDFWTTWCGPCHADFPSVKLVHQLYGDDVVVVAVHDNSVPKDLVREHAEKIGLPFPVMVDHPDGRTLARYEKHGISGYPSYMLIGPDGKVLMEDCTIPNPKLRTYKLEIIREHVLRARSSRN